MMMDYKITITLGTNINDLLLDEMRLTWFYPVDDFDKLELKDYVKMAVDKTHEILINNNLDVVIYDDMIEIEEIQ